MNLYFIITLDKPEDIQLSSNEMKVTRSISSNAGFLVICSVGSLGVPSGKLSWIFGSQTLNQTHSTSLTLNRDPLQRSHTGNYTCQAKSDIGSVSKTIEFVVTGMTT